MDDGSSGRKQNILINTGGTISTSFSDGFLRANQVNVSNFFGEYSFDKEYSPFCVLSENLEFGHLETIKGIIEGEEEKTKSFIITAGTDNLSFMANYLAIALAGVKSTIVIVSADKPLDDKSSNGFDNIKSAISFVELGISGVFVTYKNENENITKIHYGSRVMPLGDFDGYCESALGKICGYYENDNFMVFDDNLSLKNGILVDDSINKTKKYAIMLDEKAQKHIHYIIPHIGFDFNAINSRIDKNDIVVSNSYHSGTIKTNGENSVNSLDCRVMIGGCKDGSQYESKENIKENVEFICGITAQCLYIKCLFAYSLNEMDKADYIKLNVAGEYFM